MLRGLFSVVVLAMTVACFDASIDDGEVTCGERGLCPEGFVCGGDNHCYRGSQASAPALFSVSPNRLSGTGTVVLEGRFGGQVSVVLPGDVTVQPEMLGPTRAVVTVPPSTPSGTIAVSAGRVTSGALDLTVTTYAAAPSTFRNRAEQIGSMRDLPRLTRARQEIAAVRVGQFVYVIGGANDDSGPGLTSIDRARVNADGSLSAFADAGVALLRGRAAYDVAVIGNWLYVFGGRDGGQALASVERAAIGADGVLGAFTDAVTTLVTPRQGASVSVIGDHVYVIGGENGGSVASIESAEIANNGDVGAFVLADTSLATARHGHTAVVTRSAVYVIGGDNLVVSTINRQNTIERATLNDDGSLGTFAVVAGATTVASGRSATRAVRVGNDLYLVGGSDQVGQVNTLERTTISADGALGAMTAVADVTLVSARRKHAALVIGQYLYVLGGKASSALDSVERCAFMIANQIGGFSTETSTLPSPRARYASVSSGRYVYLIGGFDESFAIMNSVDRAAVRSDGSLGPFERLATVTMEVPRRSMLALAVGPYIYLLGGRDQSNAALGSVERATVAVDGSLGPFTRVSGASLDVPRGSPLGFVVGSSVYVIGGDSVDERLASIARASVSADGTLGSFSTAAATLTTPRAGGNVTLLGNTVYVTGGCLGATPTPCTNSDSSEQANVATDGTLGSFAASTALEMGTTRVAFAATAVGDNVVVLGGSVLEGGDVTLTSIERASLGALDFQTLALDLPLSLGGMSALFVGDSLYVFGGARNSFAQQAVYRAVVR